MNTNTYRLNANVATIDIEVFAFSFMHKAWTTCVVEQVKLLVTSDEEENFKATASSYLKLQAGYQYDAVMRLEFMRQLATLKIA